MYILGITGGIGSGKSTASNYLKKKGSFLIGSSFGASKSMDRVVLRWFGASESIPTMVLCFSYW